MNTSRITRRAFLAATTTAAASAAIAQDKPNTAKVVPGKRSPNELLNIGCIGNGGMGQSDTLACRNENLIALCDVDADRAAAAFKRFSDARKFTDYREMLDKMPELDAVTVSTPDFNHAPAAYRAMKLGKHVYVQKPLTHTVAEAQLLQRTAEEMKVATQMGNQGHSGDGVRECCEMVWTGAIGPVREVHAWTFRPQGKWPQGIPEPLPGMPVPETMAWDTWLGPAQERPYNEGYAPRNWRGWYDFGNGALGDMAAHVLDPPYWALKLGEASGFSIEIVRSKARNDHTFPLSQVLKYSFPERAGMPPVDIYWYDGGELPPWPEAVPKDEQLGDGRWPDETDGSYFVGDEGLLTTGTYGQKTRLLPASRMADYTMPDPMIPRIDKQNHYENWLQACKGGEPACSNFSYSAQFSMLILLGALAMRVGEKITWDAQANRISSPESANALLTKPYREGWELPL
ncbi:MAG: twin-arginine translocation signal domain-containing protein [Candidatus Hydrogenedens sp.]|nr:twin-arginine translocation signal domain-containing protein [Candidatus Hydrogenedens sp.]